MRIDLEDCAIRPWRRSDGDRLIRHADNRKIWRNLADVFEWNPASRRVLVKIGCVREGVLRRSVCKDGQGIDRVLYAITRGTTP